MSIQPLTNDQISSFDELTEWVQEEVRWAIANAEDMPSVWEREKLLADCLKSLKADGQTRFTTEELESVCRDCLQHPGSGVRERTFELLGSIPTQSSVNQLRSCALDRATFRYAVVGLAYHPCASAAIALKELLRLVESTRLHDRAEVVYGLREHKYVDKMVLETLLEFIRGRLADKEDVECVDAQAALELIRDLEVHAAAEPLLHMLSDLTIDRIDPLTLMIVEVLFDLNCRKIPEGWAYRALCYRMMYFSECDNIPEEEEEFAKPLDQLFPGRSAESQFKRFVIENVLADYRREPWLPEMTRQPYFISRCSAQIYSKFRRRGIDSVPLDELALEVIATDLLKRRNGPPLARMMSSNALGLGSGEIPSKLPGKLIKRFLQGVDAIVDTDRSYRLRNYSVAQAVFAGHGSDDISGVMAIRNDMLPLVPADVMCADIDFWDWLEMTVLPKLDERRRLVVQFYAEGMTDRNWIAERLNVSCRTIDRDVEEIKKVLPNRR